MRVLISAYACEPCKGSEPGVGWNWVRQVSRWHEVWVITRENNRGAIEAAAPPPNVHWIYYDLPDWMRFWKRGPRGVHLYYLLWQLGAYWVARKLHRRVAFDLAHHVTLVNYWMPSLFALLPVPFIWGPVGGGESAPPAFRREFGFHGKVYEALRDLARQLGQRSPLVRMTARRAEVAIATTEETAERLRELGCRHVQVVPQVGLPSEEITRLGSLPTRQGPGFRVVSVGNLLHWKGFSLGLQAFARFQMYHPRSEYWIVGTGPERGRLDQLARKLGVSRNVTFWGALPREQVLEKLQQTDALLHPSLHDSGGWVCLEAMATRHPVICLDLGGPALQVIPGSGIKLPAKSPEQVVSDLTAALLRLAQDSRIREQMGEASRLRVQNHFDWTRKGEQMQQIYQTTAPAGGMPC